MIRDPKDLQRYNASERANHWVVGISFILLALSGLAFFHPALFPLTQLFGGPVWTRILHPFIGVLMALSFLGLFLRFRHLNQMTAADKEWLARAGEMVNGNDHNMPEQGKYNGGPQDHRVGRADLARLLRLRRQCGACGRGGACRRGRLDDCPHHGARVRRHLGQGDDPCHVVRHRHPRLGQAAPPRVVP